MPLKKSCKHESRNMYQSVRGNTVQGGKTGNTQLSISSNINKLQLNENFTQCITILKVKKPGFLPKLFLLPTNSPPPRNITQLLPVPSFKSSRGWGVGEGGQKGWENKDGKRLCLEQWAQGTVCRSCFTELHT